MLLACWVVRVGGALSASVDGAAKIGLSTTIIESSGATSVNVADLHLQSTGHLDGSVAEESSFGTQALQVLISMCSFAGLQSQQSCIFASAVTSILAFSSS